MSARIEIVDDEYVLTLKIPLWKYKSFRGQIDGEVEMLLEAIYATIPYPHEHTITNALCEPF